MTHNEEKDESIKTDRYRTETDVGISRQENSNSRFNCISYVQKLICIMMKNTLYVINKKLDIAKEKISQFEGIAVEIQNKQREKIILNEQIISDLWKYFKNPNIHVNRVTEERNRKIMKNMPGE